MKLIIKQLTQNKGSTVIVPLTIAEAVLVKSGDNVITLDNALLQKIENIVTPVDSGLLAFKQNLNIVLTHTNSIIPNSVPLKLKIQYDSRGHIVDTSPIGKITVTVNNKELLNSDSLVDLDMKFGDDFNIDVDNNIQLTWKNS